MLSAQQVLPKQLHDNGQSNIPPAPERLEPDTQRQWESEHFSPAPGLELAWEAWHRTRTPSRVWLPYGRTQERRGDTCRKVILWCWEPGHRDIVAEENPREHWDLTPEGRRAETAAVGDLVSPEKQTNQKSAQGRTLRQKAVLKCFILDPKQLAYPPDSQTVSVKSNIKGGRLAPIVNVEEMTLRLSRLLQILGAFHLCSKRTTLQFRWVISTTFLKKSVMVLYSLSFAFGLLNFSETLKQGRKVFFEMVKSHRAMNTVGAQQVSWTRRKETPVMAKMPCPNGFIPHRTVASEA